MSWVASIGQIMHYIQAWKIFTTHSAEDISLVAYFIWLFLLLNWLLYGLIIQNKVIVISEILGTIGASLVIIGTILYS